MGRHKTKEEGLSWFEKYESGNFSGLAYYEAMNAKNFPKARERFRKKLRDYKRLGEIIIISMSEKKSTGRPKKEKVPNFDNGSREELAEVARRYYEITKEKSKKEKKNEASSLSLSKTKIAEILGVSRSGLYYLKKSLTKKNQEVLKVIENTFKENSSIFGRDRIAAITGINYRRVGRYMKYLELKCKVRKARKASEIKNTKVKYEDLVKRNYSMENVIATDVSYIQTSDGFVYLSAAIHHKTKMIESGNLSKYNNCELVLKHFRDMKLNNMIVHSDHGFQYSSGDFLKLSKSKNFKISMSRIGNSLDNREIEYFFSNLKSECLYHETMYKRSFDETKEIIKKYIGGYNTKRPQSCLGGKTPEQFVIDVKK